MTVFVDPSENAVVELCVVVLQAEERVAVVTPAESDPVKVKRVPFKGICQVTAVDPLVNKTSRTSPSENDVEIVAVGDGQATDKVPETALIAGAAVNVIIVAPTVGIEYEPSLLKYFWSR